MKKTTLLLFSILIFFSCNSIKTTEKAINTGDYDKAISLSVKNLAKNKYKEKNQPYVVMLHNAFKKASDRDLSRISFLEKENNAENLETIYNLYHRLNNRQEKIKPLLPLKNVNFKLTNYDNEILQSKENYANYLYENGVALLKSGVRNKINYRRAYDELKYLDKINSNYKNTRDLLEEAHIKGTDYVFLSVSNETDQIIPRRLEDDLLAMDTYGLNNLWTVYHSQKNKQIRYDFDLELNLREIKISPEQIHEKEIIKEKQLKDGFKYLVNNKGVYVKDSLGNKIKVDKFRKIRCQLYRFTQYKSSKVIGVVKYYQNSNNQLIESFPIQSEFLFEHVYANYKGDRRALDNNYLNLTKLKSVRFPSNEQMVYDTGSDLKEKLKHIITRNKFRN
ncbi:hypothetical protein [Tenacibaculum haliotis]|uniref:hypothetical protein n=1 Tax=Tenacibaculum haliotis TaxID=1888914 RepID=UPI0021AF4D6D|nr:hypothetical protein [Tenacibaculum haliotis]MCT4698923.1 hypothetical protein [Tenacibaculum haliotis]